MVGLCESNIRKVFLGWNEILSTHTKINKYIHFGIIKFFTLRSISPSILGLEKATICQIKANLMGFPQNLAI